MTSAECLGQMLFVMPIKGIINDDVCFPFAFSALMLLIGR